MLHSYSIWYLDRDGEALEINCWDYLEAQEKARDISYMEGKATLEGADFEETYEDGVLTATKFN